MRATCAGLVVGVATFAIAILPAQVAHAATDVVTTCSGSASASGSLPYEVANASSGDTVTFANGLSCPPGSPITLSSPIAPSQSVTITGPGASTMAVSGNNSVQVFTVNSGIGLGLSGLTIEDGSEYYTAGAILNEGSLTVADATFTGNTNTSGYDCGAIDNIGGTMTVAGSTFTGNSGHTTDICNDDPPTYSGCCASPATTTITDSTITGESGYVAALSNGGGSTMIISGSTFKGNSASHGAGVVGSGTDGMGGTLTVSDSSFSGNSGGQGGAIQLNSGTGSISDSTFTDNSGSGQAGAIDIADHAADCGACAGTGTVTISGSTFSGNVADSNDGGAILNGNGGGTGTVTVSNSTFTGNSTASGYGGGAIANVGGTFTVTNSTLSGNTAGSGGSGDNIYNAATLTLEADIVANPSSDGDCGHAGGTFTDEGYNIADDNSCGFTATGSTNGSATIDDSLGILANNGGPTETIALAPGSPAIAAVSNSSLCPATDQRGIVRSFPCDMGAYDATGFGATELTYSCTGSMLTAIPGAPSSFESPLTVTEAPQAPSAITEPATLGMTPSFQFALPSSLISQINTDYPNLTQITYESATLAIDQADQASSTSSFSAATETASSSDTPESYVLDSAYGLLNFYPVTWTSVAASTGAVDFTPDGIAISVEGVGSGTTALSCTPFGTPPTLTSTTVDAASPSPSLAAVGAVAPSPGAVTPGAEAFWPIAVNNTSAVSISGLTLTASASAPFDLSATQKSTTGLEGTCSAPASDGLSCPLATLAPGQTTTVYAYVKSTGLAGGSVIDDGTVQVAQGAPSTLSTSGTLSDVDVVAPSSAVEVVAAAAPGKAVKTQGSAAATTLNPVALKVKVPKKVKASTLPGAQANATHSTTLGRKDRGTRANDELGASKESAKTALGTPPSVSISLGYEAPHSDSAFTAAVCPAGSANSCLGSLAEVGLSSSQPWTDSTHPLKATLSFNLALATGKSPTNVTLWVDEGALSNGVEHIVQVVACSSKTQAVPNPCYSSEKTAGTGSTATATFAVNFVSFDPIFGTR
jgi:hypothetical protein